MSPLDVKTKIDSYVVKNQTHFDKVINTYRKNARQDQNIAKACEMFFARHLFYYYGCERTDPSQLANRHFEKAAEKIKKAGVDLTDLFTLLVEAKSHKHFEQELIKLNKSGG